jgi:hypothetical protein
MHFSHSISLERHDILKFMSRKNAVFGIPVYLLTVDEV